MKKLKFAITFIAHYCTYLYPAKFNKNSDSLNEIVRKGYFECEESLKDSINLKYDYFCISKMRKAKKK